MGTHRYRTEPTLCAVRCVRRPSLECMFKVVVRLRGEVWTLANDECEWTHSHGDERETQDTRTDRGEKAPMSGSGMKTAIDSGYLSGGASALSSLSGSGEEEDEEASEDNTVVSMGTIRCNRGDNRYAEAPGGKCPFRFTVRKLDTGKSGWVVDSDGGCYLHNHGARNTLLQDPAWRPSTICKDLRAAFGLPPRKKGRGGLSKKVAVLSSTKKTEPVSPNKAGKGASPKTNFTRSPPGEASMDLPLAHPRSKSNGRFVNAHRAEAKGQDGYFVDAEQHQPSTKRPRLSPATLRSLPPSTSSSHHPSTSSSHHPSTATSGFSPSSPTLTDFLSSLHPSLPSLAPHLASAGVDSIPALTQLCLLDEGTLAAFLDLVEDSLSIYSELGVAMKESCAEQLRLLARSLKGMRDKG
ncbi:hypothetical protein JCM11641_000677 [Rhodosporidiobolus odoratus]